jgi:shikimate dehydrogenase
VSSPAVQPILALLASPVGGNPTQYAVEKAFAAMNLDWRFLSFEVAPDGLADAVKGMRAMGFRGGAIANPHRRAVLPLLDEATQIADQLGSVNFIRGVENRLIGDNTEGRGLLESLRKLVDPAEKRCLVFDAGEIGRAVTAELAAAGAAEVRIADPSAEKAATAAGLFEGKFRTIVTSHGWEDNYCVTEDIDIAVRANSIAANHNNHGGHRPSLDANSLRPELIVADLAVDPDDAWLLHAAAARQCKTIDGLTALVEQIAVDFRLWTTLEPDRQLMREAVEEFLEL